MMRPLSYAVGTSSILVENDVFTSEAHCVEALFKAGQVGHIVGGPSSVPTKGLSLETVSSVEPHLKRMPEAATRWGSSTDGR